MLTEPPFVISLIGISFWLPVSSFLYIFLIFLIFHFLSSLLFK